jgi:hypothetical protein
MDHITYEFHVDAVNTIEHKYCHDFCVYRRGLDWWPDLLESLIRRVTTLYSPLSHASGHNHTSESASLHDWRFTVIQFVLVPNRFRVTTRDLFLRLNPFSHSSYATSSLMKRWVCLLWTGFAFVAPSLPLLLITARHGPRRKRLLLFSFLTVETRLFSDPLPINDCCIPAYLAVIA